MKTLSTIESLTGGLMSARLTSIPGSSHFFKGSIVTYSNDIKEKLGINIKNGVVNPKVALQMSKKGNEYFETDICVSFTGNAGPTSLENKPIGLVYIAINDRVYELNFVGTRKQIREKCVNFAIQKLKFLFPSQFSEIL